MQAAASTIGALMIIINLMYGLMLLLVSYKHNQDILKKKYERVRMSASGAINYLKGASSNTSAKVGMLGLG